MYSDGEKGNEKENIEQRRIKNWRYQGITEQHICGTKFYHLGPNVIMWDEMLLSGTKCYRLELMLSSGAYVIMCDQNFIMWKQMLSSGQFCAFKWWATAIVFSESDIQ
jgi:hypothetical protein